MFEFYCILTGIMVAAFVPIAYRRTRDALHPAIVMAPMFLFTNTAWPLLLNRNDGLAALVTQEAMEKTALIYMITLAAFYFGLISQDRAVARNGRLGSDTLRIELDAVQRHRLYVVSVVFGVLALASYWYAILNVGGFASAYGQAKGGGYAESGYIGEATLLAFPAILFLALSKRGARHLGAGAILLALLYASPHLLQGTFGGRRGPLFLALVVLFFAWHVATLSSLTIRRIMAAIGVAGLLVIFVWSQRQDVYLGSEEAIDTGRVTEIVAPEEVGAGNTYVASILAVSTADYFEKFYWGYRYLVTLLIRPIPKQIWPTKYQDMGADWLYRHGDEERTWELLEATGQFWVSGAAMPAIADGYIEFKWGVIPLFYLTGLVFALTWRRRAEQGGFWEVIYLIMIMLGIYLATQSYTAWAHRLLFIGVPTVLVWRYWIMRAGPGEIRAEPH